MSKRRKKNQTANKRIKANEGNENFNQFISIILSQFWFWYWFSDLESIQNRNFDDADDDEENQRQWKENYCVILASRL